MEKKLRKALQLKLFAALKKVLANNSTAINDKMEKGIHKAIKKITKKTHKVVVLSKT
ncbi:hypothetical protein [Parasediminibacterium sp. JCM 36343]|uniref:hypothetical protein n=1 Tax=Parasediminibacterium sp. JCM 36343 TaxID=3374279 RepID=UPI00397BAE07